MINPSYEPISILYYNILKGSLFFIIKIIEY